MAEKFLHGVEVIEIDAGPRPIQILRSSVIGLIGTAPNADPVAFPLNKPVVIAGNRREAAKLDTLGTGLGTLPAAIDTIFDQAGAVVVVVRVEQGLTDAQTEANVIGGVDAMTGAYEGVQVFLGAQSMVGLTPRILIAPGFTHTRPEDPANPGVFLANPVTAELVGVAERLRAVIIADGPNTNDADALAYAEDFGSKRIYLVDPKVTKSVNGVIKTEWSSPAVAGIIAKTDNDLGFWNSPSNKNINGIIGTSRPIDFALGDANSRANLLNEGKVATIIREDGYRLWGNRTLSSDPKFAFLSVVRTADIINDSLLRAHLYAVDRNITKQYVEDIVESVNAFLRFLTTIGAILGGECYADPELNTPDQIAQGKIFFDFRFTPPYPAEHITFRSQLTNEFLTEIF